MSQVAKKFLGADSVDGSKVLLANNQALRARNAANSADVELMKLDASNILQFSVMPQVSSDAASANELVRKSQFDTALALKLSLSGGTMSGAIAMGTNKITGLGDPTAAQDAATKNYVDAVATGLDVKQSVRLATAAALPANTPAGSGVGKTLTANANGALSVDSVAVALNDRILVMHEGGDMLTPSAHNGIYVVTATGSAGAPWVLTRATDADGSPVGEVTAGMFAFVEEGSTNAFNGFSLMTVNPITLDTTTLQFTQFSGAGQLLAGDGISITGNTIAALTAVGSPVYINAGELDLRYDTAFFTTTVGNELTLLNGSITLAKLGAIYGSAYTDVSKLVYRDANGRSQFADPSAAQDAATKNYVDTADALKLSLSGGTMTGDILANVAATFTVKTVDNAGAATKDFAIKTGDAGVGNSGAITIQTGTAAGSRGTITLDGEGITLEPNGGDISLMGNVSSLVKGGVTMGGISTLTAITSVVAPLIQSSGGPLEIKADDGAANKSASFTGGAFLPTTDNFTDLGTTTKRWSNVSATWIDTPFLGFNDSASPSSYYGEIDANSGGWDLDIYSMTGAGGNANGLIVRSEDAAASKKVRVQSGNASAGNSGDVEIASGTATGTRGKVLLSGSSVDVNNTKVVNLATPTASTDAATKGYVDGLMAGAGAITPVVAVAVSNITLSGAQTIDGVSAIAGDRVLVAGQTLPAENGVYVVAAGAWSRATDFDAASEFVAGVSVAVKSGGTTYGGSLWILQSAITTLGTDAVSFKPAVPVFNKESKTLIAGDITNQYVDLAYKALPSSLMVVVSGLVMWEGVDYNLSVVGGVTRVTFAGDLATGGASELIAGDVMRFQYSRIG